MQINFKKISMLHVSSVFNLPRFHYIKDISVSVTDY